MSNPAYTVTGITVFVRVCPPADPSAPLSRRASAILDKKASFASSYALKNSFISSKTRKSSLPTTSSEKCISVPDERTIRVLRPGAAARDGDKEYSFNKVFPEDSTQEELCINIHDHALEVVNGFNSTIICHGASKSGKSYTMTGTKDARGIIPHAIKSVFSHIDKIKIQEPDLYFYTELGYVELYNNCFRDLLQNATAGGGGRDGDDDESVVAINDVCELDSLFDTPSVPASSAKKAGRTSTGSAGSGWGSDGVDYKIQVHESKNLGVFLSGSPTLRVPVSSAQDVFQLYSRGQRARSSRVTDTGHVSSRSHAILILYVESRSFAADVAGSAPILPSSSGSSHGLLSSPSSPDQRALLQGSSGLRMSKLTFVDMAGADRLEISGAVGDTLVESQNINLSLTAFGDVLFALSKNAAAKSRQSKGMQHVPYLNSKLTQLLKESLGGNAKTVMITTIHATSEYSKVTETSLQYATWASNIRGRVVRNDLNIGERWIQETDPEIIRLRKLLEERSREFAKLRFAQLTRSPSAPGSSSLVSTPSAAAAAAPEGNSPLAKLQKRLSESALGLGSGGVPESKSSFHENSLKSKIADLEMLNSELKEDLARKTRQSADLSISLKKSLELIQQQNKALTDQLSDVAHEKDAQIEALNEQLAAMELDLARLRENVQPNQGDVDSALNAANAELERAKKSAWDRYLTITQQQERISSLEELLAQESAKSELMRKDMEVSSSSRTQDLQRSLEEQRQSLEAERANLHAALKAAEDHVYDQEQHLQEQHASQAYQISSLKDRCEALKAELDSKESDLAKATQNVQEAQEQLASESQLLNAECTKSSDLQASLDMHIALVASLKLKLSNLQAQHVEESNKYIAQQETIARLEEELKEVNDTLAKTLKDYDQSGAELHAKAQSSAAEVQRLRSAVENKDLTIQNLESRLASQNEVMTSDRSATLQQLQELQDQLREQLEAHQQQTAKFLKRNAEADSLETALRVARSQLEEATVEVSLLSKKVAGQEQLLSDEKCKNIDLSQSLQRAQKLHEVSVTQFTDELLELNVKLQNSTNMTETLNLTIAEDEKQIQFLRDKIAEIMSGSETEAFATQEQLMALESQIIKLEAELAKSAAQLAENEADRKSLSAEVASRDTDKQRLLEKQRDLEDKLAREVQKRKADMEAANEARKEAQDASMAEFEEFSRLSAERVAGLEGDLARAEMRYDELVAAFHDRSQDDQTNIAELKRSLEEKEAEVHSLMKKLEEADSAHECDIQRAQQNAAESAEQLTELANELAANQVKYASLTGEHEKLSDELVTLRSAMEELSRRNEASRNDLYASLDTQTALVSSLRLKLEMTQSSLDEECTVRRDREQRVGDLERVVKEMDQTSQNALKAHEASVNALSDEINHHVSVVESCERSIQEKDSTIDALKTRLAELQTILEASQAELTADLARARQKCSVQEAALSDLTGKAEAAKLELDNMRKTAAVIPSLTKEVEFLKSSLSAKEQALADEAKRFSSEKSVLEELVEAKAEEAKEAVFLLAHARDEHAADRSDLAAQLDDMHMKLSELKNVIGVKDASLSALKDKLAAQEQRTVAEVNTRISELAAYEAHVAELTATIADLTEQLRLAQESESVQTSTLGAQVRELKGRVEELSRILAETEQELAATKDDLDHHRQCVEEEKAGRKRDASAFNKERSGMTDQIENLEQRLRSTIDAHKADSQAMSAEIEDNLRNIADQARQIETARASIQESELQLADLQSDLNAAEEKYATSVAELEKARAGWKAESDALAAALNAHFTTEANFSVESEAARAHIEKLSGALRNAESEVSARENELKESNSLLERESSQRAEDVASYEQQLDQMRNEIERLNQALKLSQELAAKLSPQLSEAESARDDLQQALDNSLRELENAQQTIAELEEAADAVRADKITTVNALQRQLAAAGVEIEELQEKLKKTRHMHDLAQTSFMNESGADQAKIDELTEQCDHLNATLDALRSEYAGAEAALALSIPLASHEELLSQERERYATEKAQLSVIEASLLREHSAALEAGQVREAALRGQLTTLQEESAENNELIRKLREDLVAKQAQLEQLDAACNTKDAELHVLQAKIAAAEKIAQEESEHMRAQLESERQRLEEQKKLTRAEVTERNADRLDFKREMDAITATNADLSKEAVIASKRISALEASVLDKNAEIKELTEKLSKSSAAHSEDVAAADANLRDHLEKRDALLATIGRLESDLEISEKKEKELLAEKIKLQEDIADCNRSYESLESKLVAAVNARAAEGEAHEEQVNALAREIANSDKALNSAKAEVVRLSAALELCRDDQDANIEALRIKMSELEAHSAGLILQCAAKDAHIADLKEKLLAEEARAEKLSDDLEEVKRSNKDILSKLAAVNQDLLAMKADLADQFARTAEAQASCSNAHEELHQKDTVISALQKMLQDAQAANEDLQTRAGSSASNLQSAMSEVARLQNELEENAVLVDVLKVKLGELEDAHSKEVEALKNSIAELKRSLGDCESDLKEEAELKRIAEARCADMEKQLARTQALFDSSVAHLEQDVAAAKEKLADRAAGLQVAEEKLVELTNANRDLSDSCEAAAALAQERLEQVESAKKKIAELLSDIQRSMEVESVALKTASDLKKQCEALDQQFADSEFENVNLHRQLEELVDREQEARNAAIESEASAATAIAQAEELQRMFEEQVALVEVLKVKLAEQEDKHSVEAETLKSELAEQKRLLAEAQETLCRSLQACEKSDNLSHDLENKLTKMQELFDTTTATLEERVANNKSKLMTAISSLARSEADAEVLRDEIAALKEANAGLVAAGEDRIAEMQELSEKLAGLMTNLEAARAELVNQAVAVAELDSHCTSLKEDLEASEKDKANLRTQLEEAVAAEAEAHTGISRSEAALAASADKVDELQRMFEEQVALVEVLKVKLAEQEEQHSAEAEALKSELAEHTRLLAEAQEALAEKLRLLEAAEQLVKEAELQKSDLQKLFDSITTELEEKLEGSSKNLMTAQSSLARSEADTEVLRDEIAALKAANAGLVAAGEDRIAEMQELSEKLAGLMTNLEAARAELVNQAVAVAELDSHCTSLKDDLEASEKDKTNVRSQLEEAVAAEAEARTGISRSEAALAASADKVDELQRMFEEQVALVEVLKVKLAEQEEQHSAEAEALKSELAEQKRLLAEAQDEIGNKRDEVLAGEDRCSDLEGEIIRLNSVWNAAKSAMEQELTDAAEGIRRLSASLRSAEEETSNLRNEIQEMSAAAATTKASSDEREARTAEMAANVAELSNLLETSKTNLANQVALTNESQELCKSLQVAMEAAEQVKLELQQQLANTELSVDEQRRKVAAQAAAMEDQQARVDVLQRMYEEQAALVNVLKVKLSEQDESHSSEVEALKADLSEKTLQLTETLEQLHASKEAFKLSEAKLSAMDDQLTTSSEEVDRLHRELSTCQESLAATRDSFNNVEKEVQALRERVSDLDAVNHSVAVAAQDRLTELGAANERLTEALDQVAELRSKYDETAEKLALADISKNALAGDVEVRNAQVALLEKECEDLKLDLQTAQSTADMWKSRVDELQLLYEEQAAMVAVLKVKLEEQGHRNNAELRDLQVTNDKLHERIADLLDRNKKLVEEKDDAVDKRSALEKVHAELQTLQSCTLADLDRHLKESKEKQETTAAVLADSDAEIKRLKDALSDLEVVNREVAAAAQERLLEANAAKARLSDAIEQLQGMKSQLDSSTEQAAAVDALYAAAQEALQQNEQQRADLQRHLSDTEIARDESAEEAAQRAVERDAALARVDELKLLFEEQVAMVEALKMKLADQEEVSTAEVNALKKRIIELCDSLQDAQTQNAELVKQHSNALTEIKSLSDSVEEGVRRIAGLTTALDEKSAELNALRQNLQEVIEANFTKTAELELQLGNLKAANAAQDALIADMTQRQNELSSTLEEKVANLAALQAEKSELEVKSAEKEAELTNELESIRESRDALKASLDEQIALVATLKERVRVLHEQAEESAHNLVHETAALEQCQADLSAATASQTKCQTECDAKVEGLIDSVAKLQMVNEIMAAQLNEQTEKVSALEIKLQSESAALVTKSSEVAGLEKELSRLRAEMSDADSETSLKLKDLEEQLSALRADQSAQEKYLEEVDTQRKAFKTDLALKMEEITRLEKQLETMVASARDQTAHVTKLRIQLSVAQARLEEEGHKRIHQLAQHEQKLSEMEVAKVESDHALQRCEARVAALTAQLDAAAGSGGGRKGDSTSSRKSV